MHLTIKQTCGPYRTLRASKEWTVDDLTTVLHHSVITEGVSAG